MRFPVVLALGFLVACSDPAGDASGNGGTADLGSDRGRTIDLAPGDDLAGDDAPDQGGGDVLDSDAPDLVEESDENPDLRCEDDADGDGFIASFCGGPDCDDSNFRRNPGLAEACDDLDNDCDQRVNNDITCTFYASTDADLFAIDPFAGTVTRITDAPALWDIDTHPNGALYGVSEVALYRLDEITNTWLRVGDLDHSGGDANGMAIDLDGTAYLTAGNDLYTIDLGTARTTYVGPMGGTFESSGDCVVNKDNTLLMSSRHLDGTDSLVRLNGSTGAATQVGTVGFDRIYGLTAAWGYLFGLTSEGELLEIDEATGAGTLLRTFSGRRWFGAASTPSR